MSELTIKIMGIQSVASRINLFKPHLFYNTMSDLTRVDVIKLIAIATKPLNLSGVRLSFVDLSGLDLTGANLTGADLSNANFTRANLTGANLTGAYTTKGIKDAILTGVKGYVVKP